MKRHAYVPLLSVTAFALVATAVPSVGAQSAAPATPAAAVWQEATPAESPQRRAYFDMAYDTEDQRTILFGGNVYTFTTVTSDETFSWDGTTWTELAPASRPPARKSHAMAYDRARDEVVLFGGVDQSDFGHFADTWVFDGETWEQRTPPTSPPAQWGMEMAYDDARGEVVMFGGHLDGDSTWIWDGTTWEERHPAVSPPGRTGHGMAYDKSRQAVILQGGRSYATVLPGDTWAWDGATWTKLDLTRTLRRLSNVAMAAFGHRVVLFSGQGSGEYQEETWELRDSRWRKIATTPSPTPRGGASLAYDTERKQAVLFGGTSGSFLGDTWLLRR